MGLADGGFMVTWEGEVLGEDYRLTVQAQRYDADGTALGEEFQVNEGVTGDQPQVVQLTNGNVVFVWEANDSGGSFGRVVAPDGTAVTSDFRLNAPDDVSRAEDPKVAALADGGFVAVWADDRPRPMRSRRQWRYHSRSDRGLRTSTVNASMPRATRSDPGSRCCRTVG